MNATHPKRIAIFDAGLIANTRLSAHSRTIALLGAFCILQYATVLLAPQKLGHSIFSELLIKSFVGFVCTVPAKIWNGDIRDIYVKGSPQLKRHIPALCLSGVLFALSLLSPTVEIYFTPIFVAYLNIFGVSTIRGDGNHQRSLPSAAIGIFQCLLLCALLVSSAIRLSGLSVAMLALFIALLAMRDKYALMSSRLCEYTDAVASTFLLVTSTSFFLVFGLISDIGSPVYVLTMVAESLVSFVIKQQLEAAMEQYESRVCAHVSTAIKLVGFLKACTKIQRISVGQLGAVVLLSITACIRSARPLGCEDKLTTKSCL